jgi:hypothetical protein
MQCGLQQSCQPLILLQTLSAYRSFAPSPASSLQTWSNAYSVALCDVLRCANGSNRSRIATRSRSWRPCSASTLSTSSASRSGSHSSNEPIPGIIKISVQKLIRLPAGIRHVAGVRLEELCRRSAARPAALTFQVSSRGSSGSPSRKRGQRFAREAPWTSGGDASSRQPVSLAQR